MPKKKLIFHGFGAEGERTSVLIEPSSTAVARRVRQQLEAVGGTKIMEVTPGFISAEVPTTEIEGLERLARVNVVGPKQFRKG